MMHRPILLLILCALALAGCRREVLATDDFSGANVRLWKLESDAFGRSYLANGELLIEVNQADTMQFTTFQQLYSDFNTQVDARLLSGSLDSSYGMLIHVQQDGTFYRFAITANGTFGVEQRFEDGTWRNLNPSGRWEPSDSIITGLNQTNKLRIGVNGSNVVFYVNGRELFRSDAIETGFLNGMIGLSAGTFTQPGVRVAFDNFTVTEP